MSQIPLDSKAPAAIASLKASEGINQRNELASVIGLPTVGTDAVAVQVTVLQTQKETLIAINNVADANNSTIKQNVVTALATRGIAAIVSEAWATLVGKMGKSANLVAANIRTGIVIDGVTGTGGKRSQAGVLAVTAAGLIQVIGLPFTPSKMFFSLGTAGYSNYTVSITLSSINDLVYNLLASYGVTISQNGGALHTVNQTAKVLTTDGCTLTDATLANLNLQWWAFE